MDKLTDRQTDVLRFVQGSNPSPTMAEIAEHFGFTRGRAQAICSALVKKGALTRRAYYPRGLA